MISAQEWIEKLDLSKHPEGGYYKELYRSTEYMKKNHLPARFSGDRCFSTSIYFLLNKDDFSAFHRINQDEIWHFYEGSSLSLHIISQEGYYSRIVLGRDMQAGQVLQAIIPAGCYFGAAPDNNTSYSLIGCTVSPGFEFADLEIPARETLLSLFPGYSVIIKRFTRSESEQ
ncbi:MAG: cupin domain-containing protein [Spirochaetales bacterium]|nr:cupin domain-containing protein [Spirochaetales bacterium]